MNIPLIDDWEAITVHLKQYVNDNLHHANEKEYQHDYALGQKVLKKVHDPAKLGVRISGPYIIEHVHINGAF